VISARCPAISDDKKPRPSIFRASLDPRAQIVSHGPLREVKQEYRQLRLTNMPEAVKE